MSSRHAPPSYSSRPESSTLRTPTRGTFEHTHTHNRPVGRFTKSSKSGDARLRLFGQEENVATPTYGPGANMDGTVEILKTNGVASVEVQIDGWLKLREVAEGGTSNLQLCRESAVLWLQDPTRPNAICPATLPFKMILPSSFTSNGVSTPLPPTYDIQLAGVPGFSASIEYFIRVAIHRTSPLSRGSIALARSSLFGANSSIMIATQFILRPRSRSVAPIPPALGLSQHGFILTPEWQTFDSAVTCKNPDEPSIVTRLYLPVSRSFYMSEAIPFYLCLESTNMRALEALFSHVPMTRGPGKSGMQVQVMRQTTVNVSGNRTEMWRTDCIGHGRFKHEADGLSWIACSGEIMLDKTVEVGGFKAGGLSIKDCIVFSVTPSDIRRSPFNELRQVVPIRLTTDRFFFDTSGS